MKWRIYATEYNLYIFNRMLTVKFYNFVFFTFSLQTILVNFHNLDKIIPEILKNVSSQVLI